jgi:hypothetical protein
VHEGGLDDIRAWHSQIKTNSGKGGGFSAMVNRACSRSCARFTQADVARAQSQSVVYFVEIGKHIKIGFTTNLKQRLKSFLTSSPDVRLLLAIPGDRSLERTLHDKLAECRVARELFGQEYRVLEFIAHFEYGGIERGLRFLEATSPAARAQRKAEEHAKRVGVARQSRAERDAYFASLVEERKNQLGW